MIPFVTEQDDINPIDTPNRFEQQNKKKERQTEMEVKMLTETLCDIKKIDLGDTDEKRKTKMIN